MSAPKTAAGAALLLAVLFCGPAAAELPGPIPSGLPPVSVSTRTAALPQAAGVIEAKAVTLAECYGLALKQSELLAARRERILQLLQRSRSILGSVFPHVSFAFSEFLQDTEGGESGGVGGTFTRAERPEAKVTLRQPVFSGFREFAARDASLSERERERLLLDRAVKLLFEEVAVAFYRVVQLELDLANVRSILDLTQERIKELQSRVKLGKSRRSEVLNVEAQLSVLQSQEAAVLSQTAGARETLSFLAGRDLSQAVLVDQAVPAPSGSLEAYLAKAEQRTDLKARRQDLQTRRQALRVAKGAHYPDVDLLGNYYLKRVGFQENIDWDVLLTLDFPLFQGGSTAADVRLAQSQVRESEWNLVRLKREIESEIRLDHIDLKSALAQARLLEEALKKTEESYRLQIEEYRYGLVNNLEVLAVLDALQETKRQLDRASVQSRLLWLRLQVAVEEIPAAD